MDVGIILANIPTTVSEKDHFDAILRQVHAAQEAGMNHIIMGQHFSFEGSRWLQPVPVLARLAAEVDPHVRLCTQILIGPLYHPVMLAEELATLDVVTEGRLTVGLGLGYLPKEYETFGIPFRERGARLTETIEVVKMLWTQDRVTFHGKFFDLDDVAVHIKPVQRPHPPIWVGAGSDAGIKRAAELADAWPITPQESAADLPGLLEKYFGYREAAGRGRTGRVPLRREIMVGRNRGEALDRAVAVAAEWYLNMAATRHNTFVDSDGLEKSIPDVMARHWVLGTAADCAQQLREIGASVPVDPIITRANWPAMSTQDSVDYIKMLGEELIPEIADFESIDGMPAPATATSQILGDRSA